MGQRDLAWVAPKLTKLVTTKIVTPKPPATDATTLERERLIASLLHAEGRSSIAAATDRLIASGHAIPAMQEVWLQVLEHTEELRVRQAIESLDRLLESEPPRRRPVLEQRLRHLEEVADDAATRTAASSLRRRLR
ncbi:MAG: hypothetical protein NVS3B20_12160 [Polyangiales bacterium]